MTRGNGFAQLFMTENRRVMRIALLHGAYRPLDDARRCVEVRITDAEHDDVFAPRTRLFGCIVKIPCIGRLAAHAFG